MPSIPSITTAPGLWNTITIAGITYPGICKVRGSKPLKAHKKEVPGEDNSQNTSLGFRAAPVTLTFTIADEPGDQTQWLAFQQIVSILQPTTGQKIQGIDVRHPALDLYGIHSLYLINLGFPEQRSESEPDILTVHVEMSQYAPLRARKANTATHAAPDVASYTATSAAEAAGNLSSQPPVAGVNFTPGPDASTNPGANSTPSNGAAGATYNPDSGFNPAPAPLDAPSESQSGPPAYDPNGGFG